MKHLEILLLIIWPAIAVSQISKNVSSQLPTKNNILDSSLKYIEKYRKNIQKSSKEYDENLAFYYSIKGGLMNNQGLYPQAYTYIHRAITIYREKGDSVKLCNSYRVLANMHNELGLYNQAISYCDSALLYSLKKNEITKSSIRSNTVADILTYKVYTFCNLYASSKIKKYNDSVISNVNELARFKTVSKSTAFDIQARLNYYNGNYLKSISFTDSLLASDTAKQLNENQINSSILKALCLMKIGKKVEGAALIKKYKIQGNGLEKGELLEELYKFEKEKGNLKCAISYLEALQEFQDSSRALKARRQIFEIQRKFDVASKDLHIQQLREEKRKNMMIAGAGLVICMATLILGIRFKSNDKKNRLLVNQLLELTQLQILLIEDEKEKERKRIGQELHDGLSGTIAAGVRYLRMMAEDEAKPKSKLRFSEISDMLERDFEKARGKSHDLYLEESDENFWKGLESNIDLFFAGMNMNVSFNRETSGVRLTPEEKTTILLVIRESITNVIRHANASRVEILIYSELRKLILEVNDDGQGILVHSFLKNVGLKSINERVTNLNGKMTVQSQHHYGTNLKVEIPIKEEQNINQQTPKLVIAQHMN